MSNVVRAESRIDESVDMFMVRMGECADSGEVIDLAQWVQWSVSTIRLLLTWLILDFRYAFDVIGQLFFSRMFGFMRDRKDFGNYIQSLDLLLPIINAACVLPSYVRPVFLIMGAVIPRVFKALICLRNIEKAADQCIAEKEQMRPSGEKKECNDMLESFFTITQDKGEALDFEIVEIKTEVYGGLYVLVQVRRPRCTY